jgi:hypothetical protein
VKIYAHFSQVQQNIATAAKKNCKLYRKVGAALRKASVLSQRNNMMTVVVVVVVVVMAVVAAAKIR